jgi:opacity protein-like surface antigen
VKAIRFVVATVLVTSAPSSAQTVQPTVARVELEVGGGLVSGAGLGATDADLRANAQTQRPFRLFTADSRFVRAPAVLVRAAVPLGRRFGLEGAVTWSRPEIRTSVDADAENAAPLTTAERIDQYIFDGSFVWVLDAFRLGDRVIPYVSGGGGYVRQLHEGRTLIEHGQAYHAGGGIKYWMFTRRGGPVRSAGFRADARLQLLRGGIAFQERPRPQTAISGSVFVGF